MQNKDIPTVTLNNGVAMPMLGLGVYQVTDEAECERVVTEALEMGYRLLDTAASYQNEAAVGRAIKASGVPREELFVTTKVWIQDAGEDKTRRAFERSLGRLGLDYLDLYLIHQPFGDVFGSWRAMEALYSEGQSRAIGVSNFYPERLIDLMLHNTVTPMVNQIEVHPFFQREQDHAYMAQRGVQVEAWGPFAEGLNNIFTQPTLSAIAQAHDKTVAQVILRWLTQRGIPVIPKSVRRERLAENMDVFDFSLSPEEIQQISTLDAGKSLFVDHRSAEIAEFLGKLQRNT